VIGIELVPAVFFVALALRSAIHWHRHRVAGRDTADDLLFAAFVTGRVGTWLAAAGICVLFGTINAQGRAFTDEASQYAWLVIVFLGLGAIQLVAAWFLSARGATENPAPSGARDESPPPPM